MDYNVVVLAGKLAAEPETREFDSGSRLVRYLITVRSDWPRRRVDVLPVTFWDPPLDGADTEPAVGQSLWVAGSMQRRFWNGEEGKRSRLEIVAHHVELRGPEDDHEEK